MNENLHFEIMRCKILVLDHPGTTWNIAFSANIPTILFWDIDFFHLNEEAQDWLDKLKEVGVFYDNPTNHLLCQ